MKPKPPPPDFSWLLLADPERVKRASDAFRDRDKSPQPKRKRR